MMPCQALEKGSLTVSAAPRSGENTLPAVAAGALHDGGVAEVEGEQGEGGEDEERDRQAGAATGAAGEGHGRRWISGSWRRTARP